MTDLDRLVRKEVSLGAIREMILPADHIGLAQIAPFLDVATDDVIFDYIKNNLQEGLAPARAEDAESELSQKDELLHGQGRAAVVDWSLKDKYTASDVTRYREGLIVQQMIAGVVPTLPLNFVGRTVEDFQKRVAREDTLRRRKLDNRIEWMIMTALSTGALTYNDGKIKFTVNYGRPADQQDVAPAGGLWGTPLSDPIGDLIAVKQFLFDRYRIWMDKGIISLKILNSIWKSDRFLAGLGMPVVGGVPSAPIDGNYFGFGRTPQSALATVEAATGISFTVYDGIYRTRPIGSTVGTNTRFVPDNQLILTPSEGNLGEIDSTDIGFAKTLTAPHPEGNWSSGYYEWEDVKKDPWMHVRGSGIKAFPVFPYMEYSYVMRVLA